MHTKSLCKYGDMKGKWWLEEAPQVCLIERLETEPDLLRSYHWWSEEFLSTTQQPRARALSESLRDCRGRRKQDR